MRLSVRCHRAITIIQRKCLSLPRDGRSRPGGRWKQELHAQEDVWIDEIIIGLLPSV